MKSHFYIKEREIMGRPKVMVIDGNSLMHRAFYALPMLTNRKGIPTNAVYGFTNMC